MYVNNGNLLFQLFVIYIKQKIYNLLECVDMENNFTKLAMQRNSCFIGKRFTNLLLTY